MAVKAKEKEMKDEKEAERKVSATNKPATYPSLGLVKLTARSAYRNG